MGRYYDSYCVGCPQGCINCGRKKVMVYVCENCGDETTSPEYDGWDLDPDLCEKCKEYRKRSKRT